METVIEYAMVLGKYSIVVYDDYMEIGTYKFLIKKWFGFQNDHIKNMDMGDLLIWWNLYKPMVREFCKSYIEYKKTLI